RQLVAQGRECLIRRERAARGVAARAGGTAGATAGLAAVGVLLAAGVLRGLAAGLGDLTAVRLEPGAGLGVLVLPLLALLLVPLEPLARLRVEALGVDVVALVVVGGGHAVEGRVEVVADGLADRALVGLLEREADPPPVQVDV